MSHVARIFAISLALLAGCIRPSFADEADAGEAAFKSEDYATAARLLMPLAEKGNVAAQLYIGLMYWKGAGLPKNDAEAQRWLLAAARQGNIGGQVDIGILYATGNGAPKNYVLAYMWFSVAADQGGEGAAEYRDHVATEMTAEELQRGKNLASQCRTSNYQDCGSHETN